MKKVFLFVVVLLLLFCGCGGRGGRLENGKVIGGGLSDDVGDCITADESWSHIGEIRCVEYVVGNPSSSRSGNVFLNEKQNYSSGFTTTIFASARDRFGDPVKEYGYRRIQVTGLIRLYQNHPEIIAESPKQIVVVG